MFMESRKNQEGRERSDAARSALDTSFFETRGQDNTVSKDVHFCISFFLFIWLHRDLVVAQGIFFFWLQHVGPSSLTMNHTWAPCIGSVES